METLAQTAIWSQEIEDVELRLAMARLRPEDSLVLQLTYFQGLTARQAAAFLDCFAPAAFLSDWGRDFNGRDGIARWNETDNIGVKSHLSIKDAAHEGGTWRVTVVVSGGGTRFTMMEFQPGNTELRLHRTDTVDYVICVSGQIDMFLDEKRFVTLRAGEVLIQRGTDHAWVNRSDKPCRLAVVLVDALPKREGSISGMVSAR